MCQVLIVIHCIRKYVYFIHCTVTSIFSVEYWHDLEIRSRGYSRSLKTVPFESLETVSYSHSIATMAVAVAVSTQHTNVTDRHRTTA